MELHVNGNGGFIFLHFGKVEGNGEDEDFSLYYGLTPAI